jgi:hypothetical protein
VQGGRQLLVVARLVQVAQCAVRVAQPRMRPSLLVGSSDLEGKGERGRVVGKGLRGLFDGAGRLAETVEPAGLAVPVADLPEDGERIAVVIDRYTCRPVRVCTSPR